MHRDMFIIRRCVVIELGGFNAAAVWSRIEFRAHEQNREAVCEDGHWWWRVTVEALADDTGLSVKTVRRILRELERDGYLVSAEHNGGNPSDRTRSYRVVVSGQNDQIDVDKMTTSEVVKMTTSSLSLYEVDVVRNPKVSDDTDELFATWYRDYPRKDARGQAKRAFAAALKKTDMDTLIRGRDLYAAKVKMEGTERRYVKLPSTWLNGECWDDDYGDVKVLPSGFEAWFGSVLAEVNTGEVERVLGLVFPMPDEVPPGVSRAEFLAQSRADWLTSVRPQAESRWIVQFGDALSGP